MELCPKARGNYYGYHPSWYACSLLSRGRPLAKLPLPRTSRRFFSSLTKDDVGWVGATELGSGISEWMAKYAPDTESLPVERSAADCIKVLDGLTIEDSGAFFNHDGAKIPF